MYAFFKDSVPLISSEPMFNKETLGVTLEYKDLYKADPSSENQ